MRLPLHYTEAARQASNSTDGTAIATFVVDDEGTYWTLVQPDESGQLPKFVDYVDGRIEAVVYMELPKGY